MDAALAFFLPLVGGYIFCSAWNVTKFQVAREEGHKLYFRAAFYAAFLFCIAYLLRILMLSLWDGYPSLDNRAHQAIKDALKDAGKPAQAVLVLISIYALVCGSVLWLPFNWLFGERYWWRKAVSSDDFEVLLYRSLAEQIPLSITTESGKVYVGFLIKASTTTKERDWLAVLPLMSGYRKEPDKKIEFTTFYNELYEDFENAGIADSENGGGVNPLGDLTPDDFEIVLPVSKIASINLFDTVAYQAFQKKAPAKEMGEEAVLP